MKSKITEDVSDLARFISKYIYIYIYIYICMYDICMIYIYIYIYMATKYLAKVTKPNKIGQDQKT